jgi:hypothetical protein
MFMASCLICHIDKFNFFSLLLCITLWTVEYGATTFYANMKWHDKKDEVILCAQSLKLYKSHKNVCRMPSSGMLRHVALVRTDVSEELGTSTIRMTKIGELGATLAITSNRRMLQRNTKCT